MAKPNGPLVRELRERNRWTQQKLARRIRRSHPVISLIENGGSVSETLLSQVAKALGVELADITLPGAAESAASEKGQEEPRDGELADVA